VQFAGDVAAQLVGEDKVVRNLPPSMGAEDFSFMLQTRPGAYLRLGQGGEGGCFLHSSRYDFNDEVLPLGAALFATLAERAGRPTHFYPMALATFNIMPPPEKVEVELGEQRRLRRCPVHVTIGDELDFDRFTGGDRDARRAARAQAAWEAVKDAYQAFP